MGSTISNDAIDILIEFDTDIKFKEVTKSVYKYRPANDFIFVNNDDRLADVLLIYEKADKYLREDENKIEDYFIQLDLDDKIIINNQPGYDISKIKEGNLVSGVTLYGEISNFKTDDKFRKMVKIAIY